MQDYVNRMLLPLEGSNDISFHTKSGLAVADGYERVVIGERGPYIEFNKEQIRSENFRLIDDPTHKYFMEYRSNCDHNVKLYYQLLYVNYADYKIHKYYISPFDLTSDKYPKLITELRRGKMDNQIVHHKSLGEVKITDQTRYMDVHAPKDSTSIFVEHNGDIKEVTKSLIEELGDKL